MRVVLDANQFISAVSVPVGHPAQILAAWRAGEFELLVSLPIMSEVRRVLLYPRLQRRHGWSETQVEDFVHGLNVTATVTPGNILVEVVVDDPSDDKYLDCALEGGADYLVSGDQHLLQLEAYRGIQILRPAAFLEILAERRD